MQLDLGRSLLAVAQLGFVSGLFVPGLSRNPCLEGEFQSSASLLLPFPDFCAFPTRGFFSA